MKRIYAFMFALAAAAGSAAWAIPYAHSQRGYDAVGGEWLLIFIVFILTYKAGRLLKNKTRERR